MATPIGQIIGAIFGGIGSAMKMGIGGKQMKEGKRLQKELEGKRPVLETPEAFREKEGFLRNAAIDNRMAGQTQMEQQVNANTSNQLRNIQDSAGSGIQALTAALVANNNQNKMLNQIGMQSAQAQQGDMANLYGMLDGKANLQQKMWEFNVLQPYMEKAAQAKALKEAGPQNILTALKDESESASSFGSMGGGAKKGQVNFNAGNASAGASSALQNAGAQGMQKGQVNFNAGQASAGASSALQNAGAQGMQKAQSGTFQPANAQMFGQLYNSGINPYGNSQTIAGGGYNF